MTRTIRAADLFCGAGGASLGLAKACEALGLRLELVAVNHWPTAIETHAINFPGHLHLCEDLNTANPRSAVPGGKLDILIAGVECTHHSTARGGKPINDQSRASAWCILRWATALEIDTIVIENVKEFLGWAPIGSNGRPLKSRYGETFRAFVAGLKSLGYKVAWRIFNSADYGDPTTRERLFIQARRGRRPIVWPEASHSPKGGRGLFRETKPWVPAREIIDWSIRGQSIFERKRPLSPNTVARIAAGLKKFGGDAAEPFLVLLNSTDKNCLAGTAKSIDRPVPTITTCGHIALCQPHVVTHGRLEPAAPVVVGRGRTRREVGLADYLAQLAKPQLGAAPPFLVAMNYLSSREHDSRYVRDCGCPVPTITGQGNRFALCEPFIVPTNYGERNGQSPRCHSLGSPFPTVVGSVAHGLVEPFIVPQFGESTPRSVDRPLGTIRTTSRGIGLVQPFLLPQQSPGRPRLLSEPLPTICTAGAIAIVEPFIATISNGGSDEFRCRRLSATLPTITAGGNRFALIEPFVIGAGGPQGMGPARSVEDPLRTVLTRTHLALVEPFIISMEHSGANGKQVRSVDSPIATITTRGDLRLCEPYIVPCNHGHDGRFRVYSVGRPMPTITTFDAWALIEPFLTRYNNNCPEVCARSLLDPMPTIDCNDRYGLVEPSDGVRLDIRFRMLQPHELAAAMSFPADYKFAGNREQKVKQIGNAWTGKLSEALCTAILEPMAEKCRPSKPSKRTVLEATA